MQKIIFEKVSVGPIEDYEIFGRRDGYSYCVEHKEKRGEFEWRDRYNWRIFPDGTFKLTHLLYAPDVEPENRGEGGTFDKSLYDDIVSQMEDGQTGWQDMLAYDDKQSYSCKF